jgi:hypothetical protein
MDHWDSLRSGRLDIGVWFGESRTSVSITNTGTGSFIFVGTSDWPWFGHFRRQRNSARYRSDRAVSWQTRRGNVYRSCHVGRRRYYENSDRCPQHDRASPAQHTVSLSWQISTGKVISYSMCRSTIKGVIWVCWRAPSAAQRTLTRARNRELPYYYIATAVDSQGRESSYSNQIRVAVP